MSFTAQLPSSAERTPPIHILCLAHSILSGFLRRDDVLILKWCFFPFLFFYRYTKYIPVILASQGYPPGRERGARRAGRCGGRLRMEMNDNLLYEAAFRKVEQAGQVVNFMDYAAAFDAAVACKYSRRSRCPPP